MSIEKIIEQEYGKKDIEKSHVLRFMDGFYKARKERGIKGKDLAAAVDYDEKTISRWQNGKSLNTLIKIAKLEEQLGVSVYELFTGNKIN